MTEQVLPPFETLQEYAEAFGDEFGEALQLLIDMSRRPYLREDFTAAVQEEMAFQLKNCQEHGTITQYTEVAVINQTHVEVDWDQ
jgi:hypothetical protein